MRICRYSIDGKCTNETVACEQCNSTEGEMGRCTPYQRCIILHDDDWGIETDTSTMQVSDCSCCQGDEALYWANDENNAFVDSRGDVLTTIKGMTMRYKVKCCPNCGKKFLTEESS